MGQKVDPRIFRAGPTLSKNWGSIYYAENNYGDIAVQDYKIKQLIKKQCSQATVSKVIIERPSKNNVVANIYTKKPGVIIGKSGSEIDKLKKKISKLTGTEVYININEVKKPDLDTQVIADSIAYQLEKRVSFRRAMKRAMQACMKAGAKGIRINCAGRLGGSEIARTEWYREGRVPLHTLRADIDYNSAEAYTTYGVIGVKVWVYYGDAKQKKQ